MRHGRPTFAFKRRSAARRQVGARVFGSAGRVEESHALPPLFQRLCDLACFGNAALTSWFANINSALPISARPTIGHRRPLGAVPETTATRVDEPRTICRAAQCTGSARSANSRRPERIPYPATCHRHDFARSSASTLPRILRLSTGGRRNSTCGSLKIVLQMDHLRCKTPHRVRKEFYMHLGGV